MDSGVPMILPKGIVINTKNVYKEVADFAVVPPDKVWEYWHVYTTTYKKLKDPTACRLENFWWHVWGSNRRFLKGSTLAKLYEDISVGPTFVPLKGPPNRWEGPDIPPIMRQVMEAVQAEAVRAEAAQAETAQAEAIPLPAKPRSSKKRSDPVLKTLSSSASKPPPPHPILKKARGPSSSGPRPTARFISPHESADEDEIPSSGSTAATASEVPVYVVASPKKKAATPTKKFVASTATKRRPSLPKRQSSDVASRASASSASRQAASQRSVPPIVERDLENTSPALEKRDSPVKQERPVMSERALGKQPAAPRRPISRVNGLTKQEVATSSQPDQLRLAKYSQPSLSQAQSLVDISHPTGRRDSATSRSSLGVGSLESGSGISASSMALSQSQGGYNPKRSLSFRAPASASTSTIAAEGTILDQSGLGSLPQSSVLDEAPIHHFIPTEASKTSILDSRLTPTQPSTSASVPLGRTRSQLTLLLEREKSRSGGKPRSKN